MDPVRRLLCGSGRLPAPLRAELEAEGLLLLLEGLPGTTTYRHVDPPKGGGERTRYERAWRTGAVAVTRERTVLWTRWGREVDVPRGRPLPPGLAFAWSPDAVEATYDVGAFRPGWTGTVQVRLRTGRADEVRRLVLEGHGAPTR